MATQKSEAISTHNDVDCVPQQENQKIAFKGVDLQGVLIQSLVQVILVQEDHLMIQSQVEMLLCRLMMSSRNLVASLMLHLALPHDMANSIQRNRTIIQTGHK